MRRVFILWRSENGIDSEALVRSDEPFAVGRLSETQAKVLSVCTVHKCIDLYSTSVHM